MTRSGWMVWSVVATAAIVLILILSACSTGPCAIEKDGPEIGYVVDVEHDPNTGAPLTGLALEVARIEEAVASPFCVATVPLN